MTVRILGGLLAAMVLLLSCATGKKGPPQGIDPPGLDPVQESIWETAGHRIRIWSSGPPTAPGLLLVHGAPGSAKNFSELFKNPDLRARYRLVALDRPLGVPDFRDQATILETLLIDPQWLGQSPATTVLGFSYGGPIAMELALRQPDRVPRVLLVSAVLYADLERIFWFSPLGRWLEPVLPAALRSASQEKYDHLTTLSELAPRLPGYPGEVILFQGERDSLVDPENARRAQKALRHSQVSWYPNEDHFVLFTQTKSILEVLLDDGGRPLDLPQDLP